MEEGKICVCIKWMIEHRTDYWIEWVKLNSVPETNKKQKKKQKREMTIQQMRQTQLILTSSEMFLTNFFFFSVFASVSFACSLMLLHDF